MYANIGTAIECEATDRKSADTAAVPVSADLRKTAKGKEIFLSRTSLQRCVKIRTHSQVGQEIHVKVVDDIGFVALPSGIQVDVGRLEAKGEPRVHGVYRHLVVVDKGQAKQETDMIGRRRRRGEGWGHKSAAR